MRGAWVVVVLLACGALGCSRDVATGRRSGSEPGDKGGGAAGAGFGNAGKAGSGSGVGDTEGALRVHVEDAQRMTLEVLTLACAGDCADIEAVAHGGNPPYTFAWEDGSTHAKRRVCLDAAKTLSVSASDSAVTTAEFVHDAQTVVAEVSAAVLDCGDGGTPIIPGELCVPNASFEGTPGVNGSADGAPGGIPGQMHIAFEADPWQECETSPDIWDEKQSWGGTPGAPVATDGATYLALYDVLGKRESAGAALCAPLIAGHTYSFQVDTAFRTQGSFTAAAAGALEIWMGRAACGEDQRVFTSPVATTDWQTSCVTFKAEDTFENIRFAAAPGSGITGVFVDHVTAVERCP